jgi:hypothetical protein
MKLFKLVLALILSVIPAMANTYYVSSSTGSDSNTAAQAQSKSTPWKNLPGMPSATGVAANYAAVSGDKFVLKGCDVWYNSSGKSSFPVNFTRPGIKVGVDQTWFNPSCSVWNRPVFDAHTSASSSTPTQIGGTLTGCVPNAGNSFMSFNAANVTVDFIEFRNLFYSNNAENSCYGGNSIFTVNNVDFVTVSNTYEHMWRMGAFTSTVNDTDTLIFVSGCPHCLLTMNVSDNCDATGVNGPFPGGAMNMTNVTRSVFRCMSNAYKPTQSGEFGWNEISLIGDSPDNTIHPNCTETLAAGTGTYWIHDNRIHNVYTCEEGQVGNPGETDYVWNNIYWNQLNVGANTPQVPQNETPVSMFFFNNIVVDGGACIHDASHGYTWSTTFESQNNLCINAAGDNTSGSPVAKAISIGNNIGMTNSAATSAGYTSGQSLVFSPTKATSPTVGKGANLTSLMPAGFTAQDSSIICTEQTINTVVQVVCTGTPNPRPTSGAWDVGAYQFTVSGQPPAPPTNVKAVAQ